VDDLVTGLLAAAAYTGVGLLVLLAGFVAVDLATPGDLRRQVWMQRNRDMTAVLASGLAANVLTIVAAILSSSDDLGTGLVEAAAYGLLGVVLIGVSFELVDRLTPGDLGEMLAHDDHHPAVWVTCVAHLAVGAIVAASVT
jgi:uncharacterized membrane protein YjfL (UPF0719 family)